MARRASSSRGRSLKLHAPSQTVWVIALVLFVLGLLGTVVDVGIDVGRDIGVIALVVSAGLMLLATATEALR